VNICLKFIKSRFSRNFQIARYIFFNLIVKISVFRIWGCLHWRSSLSRSRVMAGQRF